MIRVLILIAVAGFLVSAVTLSAAVAITGPAAIARGAWSFGPNGWGAHGLGSHGLGWTIQDHAAEAGRRDEEQTTRTLAWSGGDRLSISLPATISYTQADGPSGITVTGPADDVAAVRLDGDRLRFDDDGDHDDAKLRIAIRAPAVSAFDLTGDESLSIAGYRQDRLRVSVSGNADIRATGETKDAQVRISGSGRADLGGVKMRSADVGISGSGEVSVGPTESAEVTVTGSGDVTLLTKPPHLRTHVSGSGQIRQPAA